MAYQRRGPKLGDSASLWNFSPSPGWSKEESQVLRLCLMKYGVGQWKKIVESQMLPGKMIQQMNGQTQRLLGQQSLAAFSGLHINIDKVRTDNLARTDVTRKGGLIIHTGCPLTKEMKQRSRELAQQKYSLTEKELEDVDRQLAELRPQKRARKAPPPLPDVSKLSREEKLKLLESLYHQLKFLVTKLEQALVFGDSKAAECGKLHGRNAMKIDGPDCGTRDVGAPGPSASKVVLLHVTSSKKTTKANKCTQGGRKLNSILPATKERKRGRRSARMACRPQAGGTLETIPEEEAQEGSKAGSIPHASATVDQLCNMGFSRKKAVEALEECGEDIEAAANWLIANCV